MSTQLLFTQMALASADLPGEMGSSALAATLYVVPMIVGLLRMIILRCLLFKVGHAKNDLRVLPKEPETCIGRFQKSLTFLPNTTWAGESLVSGFGVFLYSSMALPKVSVSKSP